MGAPWTLSFNRQVLIPTAAWRECWEGRVGCLWQLTWVEPERLVLMLAGGPVSTENVASLDDFSIYIYPSLMAMASRCTSRLRDSLHGVGLLLRKLAQETPLSLCQVQPSP